MTYIFGNSITNAREGYENPSLAEHDLCVNGVDCRLLMISPNYVARILTGLWLLTLACRDVQISHVLCAESQS